MSYIAWDTETTGLPMSRARATPENVDNFKFCRLVSLALVKYTSSGREVGSYHKIAYPDGFEVKATEIHGITHDRAEAEGIPFIKIYDTFIEYIKGVSVLVAHNSRFDEDVIFSECYRRGLSIEPFKRIHFVCSLDMTRNVLLQNMKLGLLYKRVTGRDLEGAHDALNDSRACGIVYKYLRDRKPITKDIGVRKIILKASEVAGMIGKNPYKKPSDIVNELWSKYRPDTFIGKTKEQIALQAIQTSPVARDLLRDSQNFKSTGSSSVEQKLRAVTNQLEQNAGFDKEQLDSAKEYIRKTLFTNHGTRYEDNTASNYTDLHEDPTFYTYDVCKIEGTLYQVVGRIDRVREHEDGSHSVGEIKNRTKGLFKTVRDYEDVQCQVYMEMVGLEKAILIEQYEKKRMSHNIPRDNKMWEDEILPKLKNFCIRFHEMLSEK